VTVTPIATLKNRLWRKVDCNGPKILATRCWVWTGYTCTATGYGRIANNPGVPLGTHVAAYVLEHGPVPDGLSVLHACDHRPCVRHLYLGTQAQNVRDMIARGRAVNWKQDVLVCPQGHGYDAIDHEGYRSCSTCRGLQARRQARRRRALAGKSRRNEPCVGCEYALTRCRCKNLRLGAYLPIVVDRRRAA
jgi:hypothetical protein